MAIRHVFTDKVTTVPADWANAVTTLVTDVFDGAATKEEARAALGLNAGANITKGSINGTTIGTTVPAPAHFSTAKVDGRAIAPNDIVNLKTAVEIIERHGSDFVRNNAKAHSLFVQTVLLGDNDAIPNVGWVDRRVASQVKDAPVLRRVMKIEGRKMVWENFPVSHPYAENFDLQDLTGGSTVSYNPFAEEVFKAKDISSSDYVAETAAPILPQSKPVAHIDLYTNVPLSSRAYQVYVDGPNLVFLFAEPAFDGRYIEARYHHNTFNTLTAVPVTRSRGPLFLAPAWADPINTPMGYVRGTAGCNVISESRTVLREMYFAALVEQGFLGDAEITWRTSWAPFSRDGAEQPPVLTKISQTEAMLQLPKATDDHYYEGCLKIRLIVNNVQHGPTLWVTLSNMESPDRWKDGKVSWGWEANSNAVNYSPGTPIVGAPVGTCSAPPTSSSGMVSVPSSTGLPCGDDSGSSCGIKPKPANQPAAGLPCSGGTCGLPNP